MGDIKLNDDGWGCEGSWMDSHGEDRAWLTGAWCRGRTTYNRVTWEPPQTGKERAQDWLELHQCCPQSQWKCRQTPRSACDRAAATWALVGGSDPGALDGELPTVTHSLCCSFGPRCGATCPCNSLTCKSNECLSL
ncbi:hypothetical protein mRhiFer1_009566 [Rhinolophus ferrumequinum]|uniref:Uncharacterized protein n=1 Tax=Rhinolophus ferrumequinum TaxID=59479 RepID=A0A7J7ZQ41_RHIFE|nr:hypothetical protein mRhiFer1_009566 [Rhinolophus ferrumequinum]